MNDKSAKSVERSIELLPDQILQCIESIKNLNFPDSYKRVRNIVIAGMGGSIYSYHVIDSLFRDSLRVPLKSLNGYVFPEFIDSNTLFIGSSYSGGTEEVVQSTKKAIEKKGLVTGISSGSKLVDTLSAGALPYYKFDPINNPSGQPRLGLGYMIFGVALILSKLGYIALDSSEVNQAVTKVKESNNVIKEKAGNFIEKIADDIAVFVSAEHLSGTSHIVRNQMNETAKAYADYHLIPELNHHLLEGLSYPKNKSLGFIFYDSSFYFNRNSRRITLTKQIVKKQNIKVLAVSFEAESKIEEFLKFLQFGSYLSFLLAKSRNLDPSVVPWVDYFKEQLAH